MNKFARSALNAARPCPVSISNGRTLPDSEKCRCAQPAYPDPPALDLFRHLFRPFYRGRGGKKR